MPLLTADTEQWTDQFGESVTFAWGQTALHLPALASAQLYGSAPLLSYASVLEALDLLPTPTIDLHHTVLLREEYSDISMPLSSIPLSLFPSAAASPQREDWADLRVWADLREATNVQELPSVLPAVAVGWRVHVAYMRSA